MRYYSLPRLSFHYCEQSPLCLSSLTFCNACTHYSVSILRSLQGPLSLGCIPTLCSPLTQSSPSQLSYLRPHLSALCHNHCFLLTMASHTLTINATLVIYISIHTAPPYETSQISCECPSSCCPYADPPFHCAWSCWSRHSVPVHL